MKKNHKNLPWLRQLCLRCNLKHPIGRLAPLFPEEVATKRPIEDVDDHVNQSHCLITNHKFFMKNLEHQKWHYLNGQWSYVYFDLTPYWRDMKEVATGVTELGNTCPGLTNRLACEMMHKHFKHIFDELQGENMFSSVQGINDRLSTLWETWQMVYLEYWILITPRNYLKPSQRFKAMNNSF